MTRPRSERSRSAETPSKAALRGRRSVGRRDQETGPSSRAKRRVQGLERSARPAGRPLASEAGLLPFRRKIPKTAAQPRSVAAKAKAARPVIRSLRRRG